MKSQRTKEKGQVEAKEKAKGASNITKAQELEPCAKPQAMEAQDLRTPDDACDDGVN